MTNEQLTEAIATLTKEVALLKNQMRGVREENMVMLEDRQPARSAVHPGLVPMNKIQPVQFDYRLGERCYYTEKTDANFHNQKANHA